MGEKERKGSLHSRHDERGREREILGEIREHHRPLAFCGRTHIIHEPIRAEQERHREAEREGKEKRGGKGSDQAEAVRNQKIPKYRVLQNRAGEGATPQEKKKASQRNSKDQSQKYVCKEEKNA